MNRPHEHSCWKCNLEWDTVELEAATQALTDMGCEVREGVWQRLVNCTDCVEDDHCETCDDAYQIWKPILRKSVVEGGAG